MEKETDNAPVEPEEVKDAALEAAPERARKSWLKLGLRFISSLRLTVALLGMAVFIVFAGTVAQVDHRADQYGMGVLVYELLSGAPPFRARRPQEYLWLHCTEQCLTVL